ncbi:DUF1294 domain-containing protein [Ensifer canadensis]
MCFLVAINVTTFCLFWYDKHAARSGWRRIRERALLQSAFFGGSIGAMAGRQVFRHKTRKEPFRTRLILIVQFQMIVAAACAIFASGYLDAFVGLILGNVRSNGVLMFTSSEVPVRAPARFPIDCAHGPET